MALATLFTPFIDSDGDGVNDIDEGVCHTENQFHNDPTAAHFLTLENIPRFSLSVESGLLRHARSQSNAPGVPFPPNSFFPVGFVSFEVHDIDPGGAAIVVLESREETPDTFDGVNTYWKYGVEETDDPSTIDINERNDTHWYEFLYDGTTGAEFIDFMGTRSVILHFVDGQRGDDDLTANGVIVDPGGPSFDPFPWQNHGNPLDISADGFVVPNDALILINDLNANGLRVLVAPLLPPMAVPPYLDPSGDGFVAPNDVLLVFNFLNSSDFQNQSPTSPDAAGEWAPLVLSAATWIDQGWKSSASPLAARTHDAYALDANLVRAAAGSVPYFFPTDRRIPLAFHTPRAVSPLGDRLEKLDSFWADFDADDLESHNLLTDW